MKTKENEKRQIKISLKNIIYTMFFILIILYVLIFYNYYFVKNNVYAKETSTDLVSDIKISNAKKIDFEEITDKNIVIEKKEEYVQEEAVLEYITTYKNNSNLPKGTLQVVQQGREGKQVITKKRTYDNEEIILEEQVSAKVTKASINKIVEIGTGNGSVKNYKAKVGDIVYVTSDRLEVRVEPNENSQKIATLNKDNECKITKVENDDWYKITSSGNIGYIKAENTTYINKNEINEKPDNNNSSLKSKSELIADLSFNMQLNKPSGLTLEQFKKVLTDSKDTKKIFEQNAEYFYYIEKQYNINGIFVASVGIHESAWGTSKIANDKKNLFGYGAYDSNPYNGAYNFTTYSESIDLLARVFVKYYLNSKGVKIYEGEIAAGTYYNGATLTGVNTKYATDKNWANAVYNYMKYLYNKL